MSTPTKVTIADKLVTFDNLLAGLELLTEEIRTRKELVLTNEHIEEMFANVLGQEDRVNEICRRIVSRMGSTLIVNGVARQVKAEIETHIDAYLETKLAEPSIEARIERLIANRAAGITAEPASLEPEERSLEELTYDSVEDIAERFRILAGENAWVG
jgi:hypothetical protein